MKTCFPKSGHFIDPGRLARGEQEKKGGVRERHKGSRQGMADDTYYGKGKMIEAEKSLGVVQPGTAEDNKAYTSISHGIISVLGRRRVMEDAFKVALGAVGDTHGSYDLFSVYDMQGGATVCNGFGERMHKWVAKEAEEKGHGDRLEYWREIMMNCFKKMEELTASSGVEGLLAVSVVIVLVGKEELVVANCGSSRAILCREGMTMPLSSAPQDSDLVSDGGSYPDGIDFTCGHHSFEQPDGAEGRRSVKAYPAGPAGSGSKGNCCSNPYLTSKPDVNIYKRTDLDDFVVIASDGLWGVLSEKLVCEVVRKRLQIKSCEKKGTAEAAAMLVNLAMARGSKDNISVIVVELKRSD